MRYKVGDLVKLCERRSPYLEASRAADGLLWLVTEVRASMDGYRCKSLTTGAHYIWFADEIEEEQDDDIL